MQYELIQILDDGAEGVSTDHYEIWLQFNGNPNWSVNNVPSPLTTYPFGSPVTLVPCIQLIPLLETTAYNYQVRRVDTGGNVSQWTIGSFTTGSDS